MFLRIFVALLFLAGCISFGWIKIENFDLLFLFPLAIVNFTIYLLILGKGIDIPHGYYFLVGAGETTFLSSLMWQNATLPLALGLGFFASILFILYIHSVFYEE